MSVQVSEVSMAQSELLEEFYKVSDTKVILNKKERQAIWFSFKESRVIPDIRFTEKCPALVAEINKALHDVNLIQSAVFSECIYAQTLANMLNLTEFEDFTLSPKCLDVSVLEMLAPLHLKPRYVYKSKNENRVLIQAGGPSGIDCALITLSTKKIFTIEFKEPGSKTTEADLPAYEEDGLLISNAEFLENHSHFQSMLEEQIAKGLNFWSVIGSNVNDFDPKSVQFAVSENYSHKKFADVICVEDADGFLVMIPANHAGKWAKLSGEIRPAGRNPNKVWTPNKLAEYIRELGGTLENGQVLVPLSALKTSRRRGGNSDIGRYKINSLFFIRTADVQIEEEVAKFELNSIKQLRPTISAHMFFKCVWD